ncbi:peptidoglycan DD-metalloendopeptidase family protein [Flavobacterium cellulosilyticum]|uniref:Peptidase M23 n=1 Tax=Flavobacterium cellulosilyticum TaxID=2541731 RepID=A0A4R5CFZ6_9FLAO|nr:peptidoglycan DD-metalloendopeptidase family protein [Flavobacterium cellulosilyticum]TDD97959.1 peptidase M23 [Flavobacterium cellulosilyticum]
MNTIENYLLQLEESIVIDSSICYSDYTPIDLSVSSYELATIDIKNADDFESYINAHLHKKNAKVAFGGYTEERNLYKRANLFNNEESDERNIHIGLDLWVKAGTPVLAALDGKVYGFNNNIGLGNYGPTIIVEHCVENHVFYTLYGHLSMESIENIEIGTGFKKGQKIGTLGDSSINGGYSPHLHFQIIKDISTYHSDYPGVCSKKTLDYYLENCPNPNLLLKIKQ